MIKQTRTEYYILRNKNYKISEKYYTKEEAEKAYEKMKKNYEKDTSFCLLFEGGKVWIERKLYMTETEKFEIKRKEK